MFNFKMIVNFFFKKTRKFIFKVFWKSRPRRNLVVRSLYCISSCLHIIAWQSHLEIILKSEKTIFIFIEKFNGIHAFYLVCIIDHVFTKKLAKIISINLRIDSSVPLSCSWSLKTLKSGIWLIIWLCR